MPKAHIRTWNINLILALLLAAVFLLSLMLGTVNVPFLSTLKVLFHRVVGRPETEEALKTASTIICDLRLPRVITAALVGASLAVSGCAMQGLLKNPLADGSILGISAGGSLGAVLFIALAPALPAALSGYGVAITSICFSFLSLLIVLALAYRFDRGFVTNTIILLGVVFSMFAGSLTSLVIAFSGNELHNLVFWMMGSMQSARIGNVVWLLPVCLCGILFIGSRAEELNAFSLGEEQAGYVGVNTRAVKLQLMIAVSALIGAAVSVSGMIGFVGLVPPHLMRLFTGSNHRKLLPATTLFGASFMMLADLISRTAVRPLEMPIGVVTSFAGSLLFIYLFNSMRRKAA